MSPLGGLGLKEIPKLGCRSQDVWKHSVICKDSEYRRIFESYVMTSKSSMGQKPKRNRGDTKPVFLKVCPRELYAQETPSCKILLQNKVMIKYTWKHYMYRTYSHGIC